MKINFLTLFPEYYKPFASESIINKAIKRDIVNINVVDFREFADNKHNKVDDIVYGGGQGMLLTVGPIDRALKTVSGRKILMSPQGKKFTQLDAKRLSEYDEITFISGRYEGFDERVRSLIDEELSIGDYVLTGGELPSMVIADSVIRLLPNVIRKDSHEFDSFQDDCLDYPQYTRPREYKGMSVPEVLLNGNHKDINEWRQKMQYQNTKQKRPDLLERKKYAK